MERAMKAFRNRRGIRKSARLFDVPYASLRDRLKGKAGLGRRLGRKAVFSKEQQEEMANYMIKMSKLFYGLTPTAIRKIAFDSAEVNHIKHNFNTDKRLYGRDWYYSFLKRNHQIPLRKPQPTSLNRVLRMSKE